MSLINDALKKAQKQRTEGTTPATNVPTPDTSNEPLHRVARREKPAGFRSQLLLIGGGAAAAVVLVAVAAIFFFPSSDKPAETKLTKTATPATPAVAPTPAPVAATVTTTPAEPVKLTVTPAAPTPAAVVTNPTAVAEPINLTPAAAKPAAVAPTTPATPASTASQFVIPTPAPADSASAATSVSAPAAPASTERPKASTRMIGVIEHYRVGGIRVSGAESKVLMNDKVYRLNDVVDFELGIKLIGIEPKALTFEDARGAVHTRNF